MRTSLECCVPGCDRFRDSKGMCRPHYYRVSRTGNPGSPTIRKMSKKSAGLGQKAYDILAMTEFCPGTSYAQIGKTFGVSRQYVAFLVKQNEQRVRANNSVVAKKNG